MLVAFLISYTILAPTPPPLSAGRTPLRLIWLPLKLRFLRVWPDLTRRGIPLSTMAALREQGTDLVAPWSVRQSCFHSLGVTR